MLSLPRYVQYALLVLPALFYSSLTLAQQDRAAQLASKLESYYGSRAEEKVHLHTSAQVTTAGRQIHYQAYVLDAFANQPTKLSKVLRVELWDKDLTRKRVTQRVKIKDGLAQGTIDVPKGLSADEYTLRAFTQWMLNYGQVASQPIIIDKSGQFELAVNSNSDLYFFPEGGHLVTGVVNKIAVKSTGQSQGTIVNNKGKEVANFSTNEDGLGVFVIVPEKGQQYSVNTGEKNRKYSFPLVEDRGLAFLLKTTSSGYRMNLQASKTLQRSLNDGNISIIVEAAGIAYFTISGDIKKTGYFIADLESASLPSSPVRISVFDSQNNLLADRSFYNLKNESAPAHMSVSKNAAVRRDRIDLSLFNDSDVPMTASISVTKVDQLVDNLPSINSFALRESSISGPSPSIASEQMDLLMLTNAWQPAEWSEVLKPIESAPSGDFRVEQLLSYDGIAKDENGDALSLETLDIWLVNHDQVYQTKTNDRGEFNLVLFDFMGNDSFLFASHGGKLASIELSSSSTGDGSSEEVNVVAVAEKDYSYKRKINQVYDFYRQTEQVKSESDKMDLSTNADYSVDLDKYIEFSSMLEIFVEVVIGVLLRNDEALRVYIDKEGVYAERPPLFFVNGAPTYDEEWVLSLDPLDIDVISVLNTEEKLRNYKSVGEYGIVDIQLKSDLQPDVPDTFVQNLEGLSEYMQPTYPRYDESQNHSRLPDLRETLYWESSVEVGSTGRHDISFFISDVVGTYEVKVEGMSTDGRLFTLKDRIQVNALVE